MSGNQVRFRKSWLGGALASVLVLGAALAPWLKNRAYLRDFEDYGLVIAAAARMEAGQRPYVDFGTAIQSVSLWVNAQAERMFGGTFQAMTAGNGVFIAALLLGVVGMLGASGRLAWRHVLALGAAIVIGAATQHTIVWYNAIGVGTLAMVAWSGALAPVLDRKHWGWNLVLLLGLIIGGANKLNFHAIALAVAAAWALRAGCLQRAGWGRVSVTLCGWLVAGTVGSIGLELAWSGASLGQWWHAVVEVPAGARGGYLSNLLDWRIYLEPPLDYYGSVWIPFTGLWVVVWSGLVAVAGWRGRGVTDRIFLVGAAVVGALAALGLLVTNHEIVYLTLAASAVLVTALWLGFELPRQGACSTALVGAPAMVIAVAAWHSAWIGQRSQFGHMPGPRSEYVDVVGRAPAFHYLQGTLVPPPYADAFVDLAGIVERERARGVSTKQFYARGVAWLERVWPMSEAGGLPLWMEPAVYGEGERARLAEDLAFPSRFGRALAMTAWDDWPAPLDEVLAESAVRFELGPLRIYQLNQVTLDGGLPPEGDEIDGLNRYGGNVRPGAWTTQGPNWVVLADEDGRDFPGVFSGTGTMVLENPIMQFRAEAVLKRLKGGATESVRARFSAIDSAHDDQVLWTTEVELAPGETRQSVPFALNHARMRLRLEVAVDEASSHRVQAGWRSWNVPHAARAGTDSPPRLRAGAPDDIAAAPAWTAGLMPGVDPRQESVVLRGARLVGDNLVVAPGGEVWIKISPTVNAVAGAVEAMHVAGRTMLPTVRVVYSKGARLEMQLQNGVDEASGRLAVRAWAAETGGWIGFLFDGPADRDDAVLRLDRVEPRSP